MRHLGGALSRPPAMPNAVGNRDAGFSVALISGLSSPDPEPAELDRVAATQDRVLSALSARDTGGRLFTFLGGTTGPDDVRAAFAPDDFARLTTDQTAGRSRQRVPLQREHPAGVLIHRTVPAPHRVGTYWSTINCRTLSRSTSSSPIRNDLIVARPITNRPIATNPRATAAPAVAATATAQS